MKHAGTAAILLLATHAHATTDDPRQFVRSLYGHYTPAGTGFVPTGPDAPQYFTPALVASLRADQHQAPGDAGKLGADPVCGCSDPGGMRVQRIELPTATPATAVVDVQLAWPADHTTVTLSLRRIAGQWRIDDIAEPGLPSLQRLLGP